MFDGFAIFFPAATCATWLFSMLFSGIKHSYKSQYVYLLAVLLVFFLLESIYCDAEVSYLTVANAFLVAQIIVPCMIPVCWRLLDTIRGKRYPFITGAFWLAFPVILFIICLIVRFLMGIDNVVDFHRALDRDGSFPAEFHDRIYHIYYLFTFIIFYVITALEIISFLLYIIYDMKKSGFRFGMISSFLFKGGEISPLHLMQFAFFVIILGIFPRSFMSRVFMLDHMFVEYIFCIVSGAGLSILSYIVLFSDNSSVSRSSMSEAFRITERESDDNKSVTSPKTLPEILIQPAEPVVQEVPAQSVAQTPVSGISVLSSAQVSLMMQGEDSDSLSARFEHLMFKDQIFLTPGLTIIDVAEKLKSNKTYISRLVNSNYGMTFPDFVNSLRIDYAEQYILHNTNAKQKDIAEACGFPSASALNNTFKKVTGLTPKIWLASNKAQKNV